MGTRIIGLHLWLGHVLLEISSLLQSHRGRKSGVFFFVFFFFLEPTENITDKKGKFFLKSVSALGSTECPQGECIS